MSIDGGGIRGIIPAQFLAELEDSLFRSRGMSYSGDERLCDYFDMIAGTSTGGIIAIGLALGLKASEILNLYIQHGNKIFPSTRQVWYTKLANFLRRKPFFNRTDLESLLKEIYGDDENGHPKRLGHCRTRVLIQAYNQKERKITVFKTPHHITYNRDYQIPAYHIALSTAAAPAYFYPHSFEYKHSGSNLSVSYCSMVDGGLVANNPAFMALMEARTKLHIPLEEISLLSVGTGSSLKTIPDKDTKIHPIFWTNPLKGPMIYEIMAEAQADNISNQLNLLHSQCENHDSESRFHYVRLQPSLEGTTPINLDSTSSRNFDRMKSSGSRLFQEHGQNVLAHFLQETKREYEPLKKI